MLPDSARKRNKKAANAKLNKNRIYIGDKYDRWMEIKTAFRLEANSEVAHIFLVSIYRIAQFTLRTWLQFLCLRHFLHQHYIGACALSLPNEFKSEEVANIIFVSIYIHYFPFNPRLKIIFP
jgi:hypothetical protein